MDGILNINKPRGETSFGMVAMVRRLTGERRVGHAGTLDPEATGVLPVCLGRATRVIEFLAEATKAYQAQIELGIATDTYDASGKVIHKGDPSGVSREQLESALASFSGLIQQTPPMYSAAKHEGKRLYQLARAGIEVERKSRPARIYQIGLIEWQPPLVTIEVVCGRGTYIRSLAHDLGQALGCGATLSQLVRLRYGIFEIKDAVSPLELEQASRYGYWDYYLYPMDIVLLDWAAIIVGDDTGQMIKHGCPFALGDAGSRQAAHPALANRCRVYTLDGRFLAVLRLNSERGEWQPEKVFL